MPFRPGFGAGLLLCLSTALPASSPAPQSPQPGPPARPGSGSSSTRPAPGGSGQPGARPQPPSTRPAPVRPTPGRPNPGGPQIQPVRPGPGGPQIQPPRPQPSRPRPPSRPGRPPQWGRPPQYRPPYQFRPGDRDRLHRHYLHHLRYINRARRPIFSVGGYFPYGDIGYLTPVPSSLYGSLPPAPPGYQMGYFDGYVVVYDPATYFIANLVDLLQ